MPSIIGRVLIGNIPTSLFFVQKDNSIEIMKWIVQSHTLKNILEEELMKIIKAITSLRDVFPVTKDKLFLRFK